MQKSLNIQLKIALSYAGEATAKETNKVFFTNIKYLTDTNADIASSKIIHAYQTNINSKVVLSDTDNNSSITYEIPNCIIKNFKFSNYIM